MNTRGSNLNSCRFTNTAVNQESMQDAVSKDGTGIDSMYETVTRTLVAGTPNNWLQRDAISALCIDKKGIINRLEQDLFASSKDWCNDIHYLGKVGDLYNIRMTDETVEKSCHN